MKTMKTKDNEDTEDTVKTIKTMKIAIKYHCLVPSSVHMSDGVWMRLLINNITVD